MIHVGSSYGETNDEDLKEKGTHLRNIKLIKLSDLLTDGGVASEGVRGIWNGF